MYIYRRVGSRAARLHLTPSPLYQVLPHVRRQGISPGATADSLCPRLLFLCLHSILSTETDLDAFGAVLSRLCLAIKAG